MIIKITNMGDGAWLGTTHDGKISHNCGDDYFPAAAIAATPNEGDAVYYEAEMDLEMGELKFGQASTVEAFNAS